MLSKTTKPLLLLLFLAILIPSAFCRSWRVGDQCPSEIKVVIPGGSFRGEERNEPYLDTMASVHTALTNCPNITSLDLRVTLLGCSNWPDRWSFPFSLSGGESYPALKSLRLEGYRFDARPWDEVSWKKRRSWSPWYERAIDWIFSGNALQQWRYSKLPEEQQEKTNLELWLDAMDWSKIEELALMDDYCRTDDYFLWTTPSYLTALQRLELQCSSLNGTTYFLQTLSNNSLTHFTWRQHWHPEMLSILQESHGQSLAHVDIHRVETTSTESPVFSVEELQPLKQMPNLTHLVLNIPRNGTWPLEMLSTISEIPSLRTADFWLDIASACRKQKPDYSYPLRENDNDSCNGVDQYLLPFVNETTALEVFKYLRTNKVGNELTNLTLWGGDWSRSWDGPIYRPPWIEHRRTQVVCSVEGAGSGEEKCVVEDGARYWKGNKWSWWGKLDIED